MEKHWIFWPFSKGEEVSESRKKFVWIFNLKECQHKYILILSLLLNGELKAGDKQLRVYAESIKSANNIEQT